MGKPNLPLSLIFVFIQFLLIGLIFSTGPNTPMNLYLLILEFLAIVLGIWAVLAMGLGNFNITPDVKADGRLITAGPYRLIRHPMYTSILVATGVLVIDSFTVARFVIWIILLVDLLLKIKYEEGLLMQFLEGYSAYMDRSARIIPFLY
ncbi:MAG: isoprenylcysteine carboxylmethyltransferase family protein [Chloroflexi bacterium]|nr:isoprenylcysteine carboxylmethyltransferase family protein [Chloroflexota bacterium]